MNPEIIEMAAKEIIELADEIFALHNIDAQCLSVHLGLCPSQAPVARLYSLGKEVHPTAPALPYQIRVDYSKQYDPRFLK